MKLPPLPLSLDLPFPRTLTGPALLGLDGNYSYYGVLFFLGIIFRLSVIRNI